MLPLANMSADPENEYFSDGMTEEIIGALSKVPGLQVASRTSCFSFKGKEVDIRQVGEKLGVGSLLTGSVARSATGSGSPPSWSTRRAAIRSGRRPTTASSRTCSRSRTKSPGRSSKPSSSGWQATGETAQVAAPTKNLEAYTLYLKGRFFANRVTEAGLHKGLEFFQHALLLDPGTPRPTPGSRTAGATWPTTGWPPRMPIPVPRPRLSARCSAKPDLAEAITSVGKVLCWHEWDFAGAEQQLDARSP